MYYFRIEFHYTQGTNHSNQLCYNIEMSQADIDLNNAEILLSNTFSSDEMKHCYSWPDGTCIKYFRTSLPEPQFVSYIEDKIKDSCVSLGHISICDESCFSSRKY